MSDVIPAEPGWYVIAWSETEDSGIVATTRRVVAWVIGGGSHSVLPVTYDGWSMELSRARRETVFRPDWTSSGMGAIERGPDAAHSESEQQELLAECLALARIDREERGA